MTEKEHQQREPVELFALEPQHREYVESLKERLRSKSRKISEEQRQLKKNRQER